jgi:hypothetical protein
LETFHHAVKATPWLDDDDVTIDNTSEYPELGIQNFLKTSNDPCPHDEWWEPCPQGTTNETCLYYKCALAECGCRFHFLQKGDTHFEEAVSAIMTERAVDFEGREDRYDEKDRPVAGHTGRDWHSLRWADNND